MSVSVLYNEASQRLNDVATTVFPEYPFETGEIIPTVADIAPGVLELLQDTLKGRGTTSLGSDGTMNFPPVDTELGQDRYPVYPIGNSFHVSYNENETLTYSGRRELISQERVLLCRETLSMRSNAHSAFGTQDQVYRGFLNNANVALDNTSDDLSSMTGEVLKTWFISKKAAIRDASGGRYNPDSVLVSTRVMDLLRDKQIGTTGSMNVAMALTTSTDGFPPTFRRIVSAYECTAANLLAGGINTSGKDRTVFYEFNPRRVVRHVGRLGMRLLPQQWVEVKDGSMYFPMIHTISPVIINHPGSMGYVDATY